MGHRRPELRCVRLHGRARPHCRAQFLEVVLVLFDPLPDGASVRRLCLGCHWRSNPPRPFSMRRRCGQARCRRVPGVLGASGPPNTGAEILPVGIDKGLTNPPHGTHTAD